jgi:hypothetical protein
MVRNRARLVHSSQLDLKVCTAIFWLMSCQELLAHLRARYQEISYTQDALDERKGVHGVMHGFHQGSGTVTYSFHVLLICDD